MPRGALSRRLPSWLLFLRCFDGISHHPAEDVREVDVALGLDAFEQAVLEVARLRDPEL